MIQEEFRPTIKAQSKITVISLPQNGKIYLSEGKISGGFMRLNIYLNMLTANIHIVLPICKMHLKYSIMG